MKNEFKIDSEIIDLNVIKPLNLNLILKSIKKTKRILLLDTGMETGSISSDICAKIVQKEFNTLKSAPVIMGLPDVPIPSTFKGAKFYPRCDEIISEVLKIFKIKKKLNNKHTLQTTIDIPDQSFKGPF